MTTATPKFKRVSPGVYDTSDGQFTLYRIEGVYPPAWNVDYQTDWIWERVGEDPEHLTDSDFDTIVDGAATKKVALEVFADWFADEN